MLYRLFIPKFFNNKLLGIFKIPTNRKQLYKQLLKQFLGFTIIENNKGFYQEHNKIFIDNIEIIEILTTKNLNKQIFRIAKQIKTDFKQNSVLLTINTKPYFI